MQTQTRTFEQTYRSYPFPVLVDLGVALSRLATRRRARRHTAAA